jgi:conjugative relaxase-like TrwC/TraI family protein
MVTISAALSAGQAKDYYKSEYANPGMLQAEYYRERGEARGEWLGELAREWGLEGEGTEEQFSRLIEGQHPLSGKQLVDHVQSKKFINQYGKEVETSEHRAGWDATFSAPKSISILAYMSQDPEMKKAIWRAHIESARFALKEMEKYACARMGNGKREQSGNLIASLHHHERSRPGEETGYAAPEIHTHAVVMNMTKGPDGEIHAMQEREFFKSQAYLTAIYRTRLSEEMQKLGVALHVDLKTGAPEAAGISREYIDAASPRREEVRRKAGEIKQRLEAEGHTVMDGAGLKQAAAKLNRKTKNYDPEEMARRDAELEGQFKGQAREAAAAARERGPIVRCHNEIERRARESAGYGIEHVMEREAVGDFRTVMAKALKRNLTLTTYDAVLAEMKAREERGELVEINRRERMTERTSEATIHLERRNVRSVLEGKETQERMAGGEQARGLIEQISYRQGIQLNPDQHRAVRKLLENQDRIVALQGRAGAGKTTAMRVFREAAERSGYAVRGIAPTTMAAKELGKSGIRSQTLESFLRSEGKEETGKRWIVLDESSLSDSKRIDKLFRKIGPEDRILLVGDRIQHQAVEAGAPFEQFQNRGIETIWIKQVVRQKEDGYRQAVSLLQDGKIRQAVDLFQSQGRVIEIEDDQERFCAVAESFVAAPEDALVIAPGNRERVAINAIVHGMLQEQGKVEREERPTKILVNRDTLSGADRSFAGAYSPGEDIVRYREGSKAYGVKKGEYARVTGQDYEQNTLTVEFEDGRELTYDPRRLYGVEVFREAERQFSAGDRIQFRRPYERQAANGELGTIEKIEEGKFTVKLQDGQAIEFDPEKFRHFDYGYAVTSYLSQGQTAVREIVHIDTRMSDMLVNQRVAQVALTRGVYDVQIVTNSAKDLGGAVARKQDKEIALDALNEAGAWRRYREIQSERRASPAVAAAEEIEDRSNHAPAHSHPEREMPAREIAPTPEQNAKAPRTFTKTVVQHQFTEWEKREPQKLIRATRRNPCPVCEKTDWCSMSDDGAMAICMRTPSDRETRNGGYIHVLNEVERVAPLPVAVQVRQHGRTGIDQRDEMNQRLLGALRLNARDRRNLAARDLDEKAIERHGYKSLPTAASVHEVEKSFEGWDLTGVPGFYQEKSEERWKLNINDWHSGFLVPVRNQEGRIEGFQIRRAEIKADEPRYVWLSSSSRDEGCSSGAPVHFRNVDQECVQVVITEGALKADIASNLLNGQSVLAVAGVQSFPEDFGRRLKEQLPDLRQAVIAFDADAARNPNVQRALERLQGSLEAAGVDVRELKWEERQGKGIDDYLLANPARGAEVQAFLGESLASLGRNQETRIADIAEPPRRSPTREPEIAW